jgi:hypothetical protein
MKSLLFGTFCLVLSHPLFSQTSFSAKLGISAGIIRFYPELSFEYAWKKSAISIFGGYGNQLVYTDNGITGTNSNNTTSQIARTSSYTGSVTGAVYKRFVKPKAYSWLQAGIWFGAGLSYANVTRTITEVTSGLYGPVPSTTITYAPYTFSLVSPDLMVGWEKIVWKKLLLEVYGSASFYMPLQYQPSAAQGFSESDAFSGTAFLLHLNIGYVLHQKKELSKDE